MKSFVTFVPRDVAISLKTQTNVISVISKADVVPVFKVKPKRLHVMRVDAFGGARLSAYDVRQLVKFLNSCEEEDVVVHCGEGKIRSPAVAMAVTRLSDRALNLDYPGCVGTTNTADDSTFKRIIRLATENGLMPKL